VRKYNFIGSVDYVTNARASEVQNRQVRWQFQTELVPRSFLISPGVVVPAAGYSSQNLRTNYSLGQQRLLSGRVAVGYGSFYGGRRTEVSYNGRIGIVPQFAFEPSLSLNRVDLPVGSFSATLLSSRFIVTPTPRLSVSSLIQFNASAHTMSSSVRLRFEYVAGSELFVVYSDGRTTLDSASQGLLNRSIAVKATRLVRF
jgi:hypothetical protein